MKKLKRKKLKFKRIKLKKFNLKGFLTYIISIFISSLILALVLISLPLTERITSSSSYDLVNKESMYWSKEYIFELDTQDSTDLKKDLQDTKSVLQKRLRKFGVEQSLISFYEEEEKQYLKIEIQTSKEKESVENLIKSPFIINVVTRKDDVNYEDQENPLTPYLEENYTKTAYTRDYFRNVFIAKLKNSEGEYSYFGIFKTWPWQKDWEDFMEQYAGQTVGVSIDGFVSQVQIAQGNNTFAPSVSAQDKDSAKVVDILFNSGSVGLSYSSNSEEDLVVDIPEFDYIKLTEGILVAIIFIYIYLMLVEKTPKRTLLLSGISSTITVAGWITYLKISSTPVDIFLLALEVISIIAIIRIIAENIESRINVTLLITFICILSILLGSGYVKMYANDLLILMIVSNLALSISSYYISNVRKSLKI